MVLELVEVTKSYNNKKNAVENLSFAMEEGDILGFIGTNGAGKSTTISMIATLQKPDKGDILWRGESILKNPHCIREELGYVPQDIALFENLTGMENLKFWGKSYHVPKSLLKERMEEVKEMMGLTTEQLKSKVNRYSGGMKRRLNIGAALLHHPQLVIMDEPTVGIDVASRKRIFEMIQKLNQQGTAILYTGHYMEEIEEMCNKICVMDLGRNMVFGTKEQLLQGTTLEKFYLNTIE